MRLRNVKKAFERVDDFEAIVVEPRIYKGRWSEYFGNDNPIYIEIGMGRGQFLINHAIANPNINYIGFEKFTVVLVKALEKIERLEKKLTNICVVRFDAEQMLELFDDNEVSRVYLNFSDPWPKDRHYKRRLSYRDFLQKYRQVLIDDGLVILKTDNDALFDFSISEMTALGMELLKQTRDLHMTEWAVDNVMTEYETKFHSMGETINMVEARFVEP